jgi:hypothetical protein
MSTTDRTPSVPVVDGRLDPDRLRSHVAGYATGAARLFVHGGRAAAFWLAALLPLTYLPMVVAGTATDRPALLAALLAAHAAALVLGRDHAVDRSAAAPTDDR